jgi:nicotinamide-nucleotide amidase
MTSIILSIGDELVLGQTVDTNSAWISQQLAGVGCDIAGHLTVPDDQKMIEEAIRSAVGRCDVLIISGGIGPTEDDLTRQAMAAVLGVELEMNQIWLDKLTEFFKSRGREMPEINKIQAMIPRGATMIENSAGTAAGIRATSGARFTAEQLQTQSGSKAPVENMERMFGSEGRLLRQVQEALHDAPESLSKVVREMLVPTEIFVMPGVPKEMKIMFTRDVLPFVREKSGGAVILQRTLHTFGLGESAVAEKLGTLMKRGNNPSVGTTVANGIVSLRLNARFGSLAEAQQQMEVVTTACETALGDLIFGRDEISLPQAVADLLRSGETKRTVVAAESCTGGLLAKLLTDLPGSSAYFTQGWVTYSNLAKYERLGVATDIINVYGAVSEPVVEAMAKSARRLAKSTYALSISGIAGPDGGSATKPVGTVCIGLAKPDPNDRSNTLIDKRTFVLFGDREMIRDRAAKMALTMLRFELLGKPLPF